MNTSKYCKNDQQRLNAFFHGHSFPSLEPNRLWFQIIRTNVMWSRKNFLALAMATLNMQRRDLLWRWSVMLPEKSLALPSFPL
jgi:hypothetical protein